MLSLLSSALVTLITAGILINASSHTLRAMWTSNFYKATTDNIAFRSSANLEDITTNMNGKNLRILALGGEKSIIGFACPKILILLQIL